MRTGMRLPTATLEQIDQIRSQLLTCLTPANLTSKSGVACLFFWGSKHASRIKAILEVSNSKQQLVGN